MVARRNYTNCVSSGGNKAEDYIPVSAACYIAKCRIYANQTHFCSVFGWTVLGGVWRGSARPCGEGNREAGQLLERAYHSVPKSMERSREERAARLWPERYWRRASHERCGSGQEFADGGIADARTCARRCGSQVSSCRGGWRRGGGCRRIRRGVLSARGRSRSRAHNGRGASG